MTDPLVGQTLDGRFAIHERLGAGAMGVVYRATQLSIGRDVAVKVLLELDATAKKRFFREAQITSKLAHPNTVHIVEFGQTPDGNAYLAMELVRGHTLHDEIANGPLSARRICRIVAQLCDALAAAHALQIVHRDLKPENIMISDAGSDHVKVLDFGIARVLGDPNLQITGTGLSAGTPKYMAPEVLGEGAEPAPSQDIYALGVIVGECALGRAMWGASTTLQALVLEKASGKAFAAVPQRFRAFVRTLTNLDPAKRPTAGEARALIAEVDRTTTNPMGIAATIHTAPVAPEADFAVGTLELVDLDQRDGAPPITKQPTERVAPPEFEPPANLAEAAPLEVEPIERPPPKLVEAPPPPRRRGSGAGIVLALLLFAAGGGVIYWLATRPAGTGQPVMHDAAPGDRSVSIRIVGKPGTPITIDGRKAGKTPMSLKRTSSTRPIEIGAPNFSRTIVPDRDQTIDLSD